jgi:hypothetical protein
MTADRRWPRRRITGGAIVRWPEGRGRQAAQGPRTRERHVKQLLADAELEKDALREITKGTSEPGTPAGGRRSPPAGAGGDRAVRLPRDRAAPRPPNATNPSWPPPGIPMPRCGRGCANTPRTTPAAASVRPTVSTCAPGPWSARWTWWPSMNTAGNSTNSPTAARSAPGSSASPGSTPPRRPNHH